MKFTNGIVDAIKSRKSTFLEDASNLILNLEEWENKIVVHDYEFTLNLQTDALKTMNKAKFATDRA